MLFLWVLRFLVNKNPFGNLIDQNVAVLCQLFLQIRYVFFLLFQLCLISQGRVQPVSDKDKYRE